jgi:hypothetical protein
LEFGIPGGALIVVSLVGILTLAIRDALAVSDRDDRFRRVMSARAAGLAALTFASFFQPQLFNLGDVHGISFILLLFSPRPRRNSVERARLRAVAPGGATAGPSLRPG